MVFYGKPSKGCEACRARKIKCDARQPGCGRCERSGKPCPGYRDLGGVIFRDENSRIVRRAVGKRDSNPAPAAETIKPPTLSQPGRDDCDVAKGSASPQTSVQPSGPDSAPQALVPVVSASFGPSEGVCYFYQEFSWQAVSVHAATWSSSLPALSSASAAIGLALLSFKRRSPSLVRQAYSEYGTAMQLANQELSDPRMAVSDSALALVVLMSYFETLTGLTFPSVESWMSHSAGAATIITMRNRSQLESPLGYQLFLEASGMMITTSLIYKTPVPQMVPDYTRLAMELESPTHKFVSRIALILVELTNLRAAINDGITREISDIRRRVDHINLDLNHWKATIPEGWDYETCTLGASEDTLNTRFGRVRPYAGKYTVYADDRVTMGWSYYRICHILVGEILLDTLKPAVAAREPGVLTMCHSIRRNMDQMAGDICSSVPYLLGLDSRTEVKLPGMMGGYFSLLPLWIAACVESDGNPIRDTAMELFDIVAARIGIGHATLMMRNLLHVEGSAAWLDKPFQRDVSLKLSDL